MRLENDGHSAFDAVDPPPPRIDVGAVRAPTIVIPVLWFGTDFIGAASKQLTALQARQH